MKKYLCIFAFLLLISFSVAQPPFQESPSTVGIDIESAVIETHILNQDFQFHLHAHNATNGLLLTNDTTNCTIHIYRPSDGSHIVEELMDFSMSGLDFNSNISSGNFTEIGQYSVLFYCEITNSIGGFFEYPFDVTATGVKLSLWDALVRIFLIIFFITLLMGTYHVVGHINFKKWNDNIIKKYQTKNFVKMVLGALLYNIMKNVFIIYYLIGIPIFLILNDIVYTYNVAGLILFMNVLMFIYLVGLLIVGLIFISYVQEWVAELWDMIKDLDWGIEK